MDLEQLVDAELRPVLAGLPAVGDITADPAATRKRVAEMFAAARGEPGIDQMIVEDREITGPETSSTIPIRIYAPTTTARRNTGALLWIHGGGFVLGSPDMDDVLCERISDRARCIVVSVDYRLAPEAPFPAGVEDCYEALCWMVASASELGIDPTAVAVGGASAGGCLAAAVALMARDRNGPGLALQLLIYPCLDDRHTTPSSQQVTDPRVWNRDMSMKAWKAYLGDRQGDVPAYAAPARATDFAGLPRAYILVADQDLLRDEDIDYARRLLDAGVTTELHVYPGTFHGFDVFAPAAAISTRAIADYVDAVRRVQP